MKRVLIALFGTKKNNIRKNLLFFIMLSITAALISGCATTNGMYNLRDDTLDKEGGYQSIVLWRLHVADKTNSFKGYSPIFNGEFIPHWEQVWGDADKWVERDGIAYYDGLFMTAAQPGFYLFNYVHFLMTDYRIISYFDAKFDKGKIWNVPQGKLIYLGDFYVEFTGKEIKRTKPTAENTFYNYNAYFNQTRDSFDYVLNNFQSRFPKLYEQFRNNIDVALLYLFYEGFEYKYATGYYRDKWGVGINDSSRNMYIEQNNDNTAYTFESKDDKCNWRVISPDSSMPANFDVEIESIWQSGVDSHAYGLVLGSDSKNNYQFGVSGNGYSKVWLYINGDYIEPVPIDWKANTALKGDGKTTNRHKVEVRGDVMKYYVNDNYIGTLNSRLNIKDIIVGVAVCDKQKVAFDNLRIIGR